MTGAMITRVSPSLRDNYLHVTCAMVKSVAKNFVCLLNGAERCRLKCVSKNFTPFLRCGMP